MSSSIYVITYRVVTDDDVVEEVCEVKASSEAQAIFLAPCAPDDILDIERVVAKKHAQA